MEDHQEQSAGNQPFEIFCSEAKKAPADGAFRLGLSFLTLRVSRVLSGWRATLIIVKPHIVVR